MPAKEKPVATPPLEPEPPSAIRPKPAPIREEPRRVKVPDEIVIAALGYFSKLDDDVTSSAARCMEDPLEGTQFAEFLASSDAVNRFRRVFRAMNEVSGDPQTRLAYFSNVISHANSFD